MLALLPDGHTDGWIGRKPVHTHEDVRRGEVETKGCQGRARMRICGHFGNKIIENFFFVLGIFFGRIGTESADWEEL